MLNSLLEFVRGMHHTTKKEDVVKSLTFIFNNLNDEVIPVLDSLLETKNLNSYVDSNMVTTISRACGFKAKDAKDVVKKIKSGLVNINKSYKKVSSLVDNELSDVITNKTITAKDAAILRLVNDIGAMNTYILDLSYYIILDKKITDLPKFKLVTIKNNLNGFGNSFQSYGNNFGKLVDDISKVSTNVISINEGKESFLNVNLNKTGKIVNLPMANGFVNNPIYHVRMWIVDRDVEYYEALKDKKRLIELRLMELKLEDNNEGDPKLRKQIEYYEDKLSKLEYKIEKIEADN